MQRSELRGFTLIELLTVIAIIAILAGLTMAAVPRALERAKLADAATDFNAIRTGLAAYYTEYKTYPLGYGFRTWYSRETQRKAGGKDEDGVLWNDINSPKMFNFIPYMSAIGEYGATKLYDRFAISIDTDGDQVISMLEYSPLEEQFDGPVYDGTTSIQDIVMEGPERPYIYVPVQMDTFKQLQAAIEKRAKDEEQGCYIVNNTAVWNGDYWPDTGSNRQIRNLSAPRYDTYVLISVGPAGDTGGIVTPPESFYDNIDEADIYQAIALRAYYLATRDVNKNDVPDFDFNGRAKHGEGTDLEAMKSGLGLLPNGTAAAGPLIYIQKG